jgi:hypothetical protein
LNNAQVRESANARQGAPAPEVLVPKGLALAGSITASLLAGGCGDTLISISSDGRLEVAVSTSGGGLDRDGFIVIVDGGVEQSVPSGGVVTLTDLREGTHSVRLSGLADNCGVVGSNPRPVVVGAEGAAVVAFEVRCGLASPS